MRPEGEMSPSGRFWCKRTMTTLERPKILGARVAGRAGRRAATPKVPAGWRVFVSGTVLLLGWHILVTAGEIPTWLLPGPLVVAARFREVLANGTLVAHLVPTLAASAGGFAVALCTGMLVGYVIAASPRLEGWIAPYLAAVQSVPVIAVAPLLIVWTTNGLLRNILVAALVVFFPIFASTVTGLRTIPRELREVARVEGARRGQMLRYVELPLALPTIFSGIRTSLAYATTGAVVAEFVGTRYGLGAMINIARGLIDTPLLFVAIGCLIGITLVFYAVVTILERALTGWREQ